eukprot:gi/632946096/ref/XP_007888388.1/ PREDICTED: adenylate cyclase type 10 [Callorhinchus milii]
MEITPNRHAVSFVRPLTRLRIHKQKSVFSGTYKICKLAANVPDLVVFEGLDRPIPDVEHFHGVLLFADISGFTSLTERYTKNSKKGCGADHLTRELNGYISEIVDHILQAGGDIVNYAGDAMLALWRERRKALSDIISLAVKCSLNIQDKCDNRDTEIGVKLRVKIGISAGKLSKVVMGDHESRYYALIGCAVDEVRKAEGLALANTIILSPNAWELCDRDNIVVEQIENDRAVKVRYIKRDPQFSVEDYTKSFGNHLEYQEVSVSRKAIRKTSRLLPNQPLEAVLRKYLLRTVLLKIDDGVPLEYLSEMRPATVVFVNLQFVEAATMHNQCQSIQACCLEINNEFKKYQGRINKVFMFDKGCTFLCCFGLPGDKGEDECANALQSAHNVHEFCTKMLKFVSVPSIGIATGPLFCGVVGHPLRHEYTVIGRKVNLAARLMMTYPGVVSCDEQTHYHAKMPSSYFSELPKRAMKGVQNPGPIYQYLSKKHQKILGKPRISVEKEEGYPILGREKEIEVFNKALKIYAETKNLPSINYCQVVMYEGTVGCGKSKLLSEVIRRAQGEGFRVLPFELGKMDITESYYTIQTMLALLLQVNHCKSYVERERVLLSKIIVREQIVDLCLLNDLLFVKFPISERVSLMDSNTKHKTFKNYVITIIQQATMSENILFVIDQVQYIDVQSWELIVQLRARTGIFLAMALRPFTAEKPPCPAAVIVMKSHRTAYIKLSGLDSSIIRPLACQILGVISIPRELEILLTERSYGVPYYCEEILKSLYFSDLIILEPLEEEEEDESDTVLSYMRNKLTQNRYLHKNRGSKKLSKFITEIENPKCRKIIALDKSAKMDNQQFICTIGETVNLQEITIPLTLKGIALAQLDRMNPTEQMIVKCASIIGHTFTTKMLRYILPEGAELKLNQSLISLVKSRTLECASRSDEAWSSILEDNEDFHVLQCFCPITPDEDEEHDEEKGPSVPSKDKELIWRCKLMRFCIALVHETANELWLKQQKKALHIKCTRFLETAAHRCSSCGEGDFIYKHEAMLKTNENIKIKKESSQTSSIVAVASVPSVETNIHSETNLKYLTSGNSGSREMFRASASLSDPQFGSFVFPENIHIGTTDTNGEHSSNESSDNDDVSLTIFPLTSHHGEDRVELIGINKAMLSYSHDEYIIQKFNKVLTDCENDKSLSFKMCECKAILDAVFVPLVRHWMGAGHVSKAFFYLLETAAAALYLSNNLMAMSYIIEAQNMLSLMKTGKLPFEFADITTKLKISAYEKACLYSLKGQVYFNLSQLTEAEVLFRKALRLLNKTFPKSFLGQLLLYVIENYKISKRSHTKRNISALPIDDISPQVHGQICCLSFLWQIYCLKRCRSYKLPALLTVLMEVNNVEQANAELKIISSYIDSFRCYHCMGCNQKYRKYEMLAVDKCLALEQNKYGLLMLGELICALSSIKLCNGQPTECIQYGRQAHKIAGILNKPSLDVSIIPVLLKALIVCNRIPHYIKVALYLMEFSVYRENIIGQASFYAACLDLLLQEGVSLRAFDECYAFINANIDDPILKAERSLMLNLHASVALWFLRLSEWSNSRASFKMAKRLVSQTNASLFSMYGYAKLLECQILVFRKALWEKQENVMEVYHQTKEVSFLFILVFSCLVLE